MAVVDDRAQSVLLRFIDIREDGFVDGRLTEDTETSINLVATVYEITQVFLISLRRSLIQVLKHTASVLILADLERFLSESS